MVPLCVRSHYSLMWGTMPVRALCTRARDLGFRILALTDTDNLYGLWPFVRACEDLGVTPVIGAEITDPAAGTRAVCLVKNSQGYSNLCRLITRRHRDAEFNLETSLPPLSRGLCVLTRNASLLSPWHARGIDLGVNLPRSPLSRQHPLIRAARKLGIPLVATPGSFFASPGDRTVHAMLRAIDRRTDPDRLGPGDAAPANAFLAGPDTYDQRFQTCPEAIRNSHALAERLCFRKPAFGTVMPPLSLPRGTTPAQQLRQKTLDGARKRYGRTLSGPVLRRINHELAIIRQKHFDTYFLVVQTIVQQASRICGRGSGAASIVAYCLGITNVCPIKHNLYFERFLNPDRTDPPDIDIDFAWDERDGILDWVLNRFQGHAAMVSSHILFQPRMAVREVARVFGLPEAEISKVSRRMPWFWRTSEADQDLLTRIRNRPEFKHMDFAQPWPRIMAMAKALIGCPRHLSVHPGGVVITPDPIDTYVPVQDAPKGVPLIQWEKDGAETAGLVKIDLLGNRSLGVIRDTIAMIESRGKAFEDFKTADPEDDYETRQAVAQGQTMGCFYIESPAMRLLQKKSRVGDFDHVVIHSSIIRPAANPFIKAYIQRLHTGTWESIHPLLDNVLDETFGIMVFQEDVSKAAVAMAGFSHARADGLRRIMSKKDKERELTDYFTEFQAGALARGVSRADINRVWEMITSFSGYSFCKPHSASYARVSFQAAYLKTHYPAPFMAAVISNQGGFYAAFAYVSEARRLGVKILGPDVNQSNPSWTGMDNQLRVGLMAVRSLSRRTMERILACRGQAPFSSPLDFFNRVRPSADEARSLIDCGSLDCLAPDLGRAGLVWHFTAWHGRVSADPGFSGTGRPGLFCREGEQPWPAGSVLPPVPDLPPDNPGRLLRREFRALGFLCGTHPMCLYRGARATEGCIEARDLGRHIGRRVDVAGWLITGKTVITRHGDPMKFITFEDETGLVETVFFPKPYARFCHLLDHGRPFRISGVPESDWGAVTFTVEQVRRLGRAGDA